MCIIDIIKQSGLDKFRLDLDVHFSILDASEREPWDQYAFDIIEKIRG